MPNIINKISLKIWVIIIIFFLGIVGGIFAFQNLRQQKSDSPGWSTYTSESYKIQYPKEWSVRETESYKGAEPYTTFFSDNYQERESEEWKETVARGEDPFLLPRTELVTGTKIKITSLKIPATWDWKQLATAGTDYPYGKLISYEFVSIANKEMHRREVQHKDTNYIIFSFPNPEKTKLFEIEFHSIEKDMQTFNQILSSFKFLE